MNNLKVGERLEAPLAVKAAEIKLTKAKKPYLHITLTDGKSEISGMYWDWPHINAPEPNTVLDVNAIITSYQDTKQLKFSTLSRNTTMSIEDFIPVSPRPEVDLKVQLYSFVDQVESPIYRDLLELHCMNKSYINAPGGKSIHHAYRHGLMEHSIDVALTVKHLCSIYPQLNEELLITAALLHDVGKTRCYKFDGIVIKYTLEGMMKEHIIIGLEMIHDAPDTLKHLIASHHGSLEFGSPVAPRCMEAWALHLADMLNAKVTTMAEVQPDEEYSSRIWSLGDRIINQEVFQ